MSDIDLAVTHCKTLESMLTKGLNAQGKGLHEKVSSVQSRLPPELVKRLRFIATIRNKIVHEADYTEIDDRAGFVEACNQAETQLHTLLGTGRSWRAPLIALAVIVAVGLAVIAWLLLRS